MNNKKKKKKKNLSFSDYSADDYIISPAREAHVVRIERESRDFYISELTRKSSLIEERLEEVVKDMERLDEENRIKSVEITSLKEDNKSCNDKIAKLDEELRERDALIKKLQAGLPPTSPTHKRVASSKPASPLPKSSAKSKSPGKKSSRSPTIRKKARTPTPPHRRGSLGHGCDLTKQKIFR